MQDQPEILDLGRRSSTRLQGKTRISYIDEPEIGIKYEYHAGIDVFAIMEVSHDALRFHLYDNQNWSLLTLIEPKKFWFASTKWEVFTVPDISFDFTDSHMIVQVYGSGRLLDKVYLAGLLSEVVKS